jgi:hypothetical protein
MDISATFQRWIVGLKALQVSGKAKLRDGSGRGASQPSVGMHGVLVESRK